MAIRFFDWSSSTKNTSPNDPVPRSWWAMNYAGVIWSELTEIAGDSDRGLNGDESLKLLSVSFSNCCKSRGTTGLLRIWSNEWDELSSKLQFSIGLSDVYWFNSSSKIVWLVSSLCIIFVTVSWFSFVPDFFWAYYDDACEFLLNPRPECLS